MKILTKIEVITIGLVVIMTTPLAYAATPPNLGAAGSFTVLSGTYSNTTSGTTLNGDLGYTTPPATAPTVNGSTHIADATYNQAGIDQGTALSALNSQPCTFSFTPGAIDLASDTTHGVAGAFAPGVYCINGAASIGGGGTITLTGSGTYIFRMTGALNTSAGSVVAVAGGASACNVWWAPGAATTLGANSTFGGSVLDASGVTIGNLVIWTGRALAFGGTVSTTSDTVSSSACPTSSGTGSGVNNGSSKGLSSASKTPGLPNSGESRPANNISFSYLVLLGTVASSLIVVRAVAKRA